MESFVQQLPTPLARTLHRFQEEDTRQRPFRAVHRLIDLIEVFVKMHTVAGVSQFVCVLNAKLDLPGEDNEALLTRIRTMLASGLRTPSLGIWWGFARETAKALQELEEEHILQDGISALTHKKSPFKKALDGDNNLISFRNGYAHGATPSDQDCLKDLEIFGERVLKLLRDSVPMRDCKLLVVRPDGLVQLARGLELSTLDDPPQDLQPGRCYLLRGEQALDLHPLLVCSEPPKKQEEVEEVFYFYNDLKGKQVSMLNYPQALHWKDLLLREVFDQRYPLHEWKNLGGFELDPFREKIESLTEVFKGRIPELSALAEFLTEKERGFHVVWGPPGVGKSALLARMTQLLNWSPEIREQASPGISWPELDLKVVEFFIRRGSEDTATRMLDSLNRRLDARFQLRHEMGNNDEERKQKFQERLREISARLKEDQRLVLVIDGLDEARANDPIMSALPRDVPQGVVVLYGSRPQQRLRFGFYDELDRERRSCVDLKGLTLEDTRALLYEHVDKYALESSYVESVLAKSEGNPLYLKLLCQGLEQGIYKLNDLRLPDSMDELYTNALQRIQSFQPRAVEFLNLLAAAMDYVSPAMAAELMETTESNVSTGPITACMELLFENPLTEDLEDYQLFHESLREYLRKKYTAEVEQWEERLADWCATWKDKHGDVVLEKERLLYAMSFAVPHLADSRNRALKKGRENRANRRGETMLSLVEDNDWRALCFRTCGNGSPLQKALRLTQRYVRTLDVNGSERLRMIRFARWIHDEPLRLYLEQREELRAEVGHRERKAHLEEVPELAKMGSRSTEKVLLALTALWAQRPRPLHEDLPEVLTKAMEKWLDEARDPALNKLWKLTGAAS